MNYAKLQRIKSVASYPFRLAFLPFMAIIAFMGTNFADNDDVGYFKSTMKGLYRLYGNNQK